MREECASTGYLPGLHVWGNVQARGRSACSSPAGAPTKAAGRMRSLNGSRRQA